MHENALTKASKNLFSEFPKFKELYLAGGTALALQIGHRLSVDFDFFSERTLSPGILQKVKRTFPGANLAVTYSSSDQLNVLINDIRVTFLYYPYPRVVPGKTYQKVSVAAVSEIAAMKAFAIGRRLSYKDYVDWYFLLQERHITLGKVIELSKKKFGNEFNDRLFLGQLVSIDDVSAQKVDFLRNAVSPATVKRFLNNAVNDFTSRFFGS